MFIFIWVQPYVEITLICGVNSKMDARNKWFLHFSSGVVPLLTCQQVSGTHTHYTHTGPGAT